jgi:zinc protease
MNRRGDWDGRLPVERPEARPLRVRLPAAALAAALLSLACHADAAARATLHTLDNGLKVVVIPDHRAPVVTQMLWYRVGSADERRGKSGIAHFLEHLMYQGTERIAAGDFSKIIAAEGGEDNAFTGEDVTAYHQTIPKEVLPLVMELEADRMAGLELAQEDVLLERDVVVEERRSTVETDPRNILSEQLLAALYLNHPYGVPIIGWQHELESLSREDAIAFYKRYYAPNNAILVVAGDVEPPEVLGLAERTFGHLKANPMSLRAPRAAEPPPAAARRIMLQDARAGQASFERYYLAPSIVTAAPREAEAIDLLVRILGGVPNGRLYRSLVVAETLATRTSGEYAGLRLDGGLVSFSAVAQPGVEPAALEAALERVIEDVVRNGVTPLELERAKRSLVAEILYGRDDLGELAKQYGEEIAIGQSIEDIEARPERLKAVTLEDVKAAAGKVLRLKASVTGWLIPEEGD